jgi:hypothetical protein
VDDGSTEQTKMTVGLDLGDKYSYLCVLDTDSGELVEEGRLCAPPRRTSAAASTPRSNCRSPSKSALTRAG